ncbi:DUF4297 domain-containing protein [Sporosarcina sp. ANT_H38]|uniref:dsDNA nuclease domain-containing protein n=1 Tax=Sporosarcina sp. ANT_H38 TaxID=2597358 RepID=UPI0011F0BDFF|nr:dsDNA nuclease domain-containing protein [Sporosarcina sp. ANT_H38]KAA0948706.1 DUF4297 domain-containing protein [Sporosarcina sp. ANT_H38]
MSTQLKEPKINALLYKKIEDYISKSGDKVTEEDKKSFVTTLLSGRSVDLSGVTAIRGFIYQYYVATKYLVEMLFSEKAWWDKVIFEILDDIALYGDKNIRFIQAKTKRDSDVVNHLKLGEMHERIKKKGSWLDKLFLLNLHIFDLNNNVPKRDDAFFDDYDLQFELAINTQYNKDIAVYEKDDDFYSEIDEKEYQKLIKSMDVDNLDWEVEYKGEKFRFSKVGYDDPIKDISWYLKRFRVKRHGHILALRQEIIDNIMSNTTGNMDTFHSYKASIILDMILLEVIKKTCQDSENVSLDTFVFEKNSFRLQFNEWCEMADHSASESATRDNLHEKFTSCFDIIRAEFQNGAWKPNLKQELLTTLTNLQQQLSSDVQSHRDPFAYHRFLHRIFNLNNFSTRLPLDDVDKVRIINALKTFVYCLVFYNETEYTHMESRLSVAKGLDSDQNGKIFSIYNTRKSIDMEWAKKAVRAAVMECSVSEAYSHDFYCFVADVREGKSKKRSRRRTDSIHASVTDASQGDEQQVDMDDIFQGNEITKHLENIQFRPINIVENYFNYLEDDQPESSFQEIDVINDWNLELSDE